VYAPAERADTFPLFLLYPYMYSVCALQFVHTINMMYMTEEEMYNVVNKELNITQLGPRRMMGGGITYPHPLFYGWLMFKYLRTTFTFLSLGVMYVMGHALSRQYCISSFLPVDTTRGEIMKSFELNLCLCIFTRN
jgi:hypothetical protein